jgi:hypothetical protein
LGFRPARSPAELPRRAADKQLAGAARIRGEAPDPERHSRRCER